MGDPSSREFATGCWFTPDVSASQQEAAWQALVNKWGTHRSCEVEGEGWSPRLEQDGHVFQAPRLGEGKVLQPSDRALVLKFFVSRIASLIRQQMEGPEPWPVGSAVIVGAWPRPEQWQAENNTVVPAAGFLLIGVSPFGAGQAALRVGPLLATARKSWTALLGQVSPADPCVAPVVETCLRQSLKETLAQREAIPGWVAWHREQRLNALPPCASRPLPRL